MKTGFNTKASQIIRLVMVAIFIGAMFAPQPSAAGAAEEVFTGSSRLPPVYLPVVLRQSVP